MRLGISTYSFWHFLGEPYPVERVLEHAAELGLAGVEVLHRQMTDESPATVAQLKRRAFQLGLDLYALAIHQDFVHPDPEERTRHIAHTKHCLRLAHELGIPCIRVNSGRWKTIANFNDLMAHGGWEPPLPGYTEDEAFGWVIAAFEACLPDAERLGIVMALENHWGLTTTADGVLRIVTQLNSDWLRVCLDTGNLVHFKAGQFIPDYDGMAQLAPYAVLVHLKTYVGGGRWYTLALDYERIARILQAVNYCGYWSLEYEGRAEPMAGVQESLHLLRSSGLVA